MRLVAILLLPLIGCSSPEPAPINRPEPRPVQPPETDEDSDPPEEEPAERPEDLDFPWHHVISNMTLLGAPSSIASDVGIDLTGDGVPNNALGTPIGAIQPALLFNNLIAQNYQSQPVLAMLRVDGDPDAWPEVEVGTFTVIAADHDVGANFSGSARFFAYEGLDEDGEPIAIADATVRRGGRYDGVLPPGDFTLGFFSIATAMPSRIRGTLSESSHTGVLATAVAPDVLSEVLLEDLFIPPGFVRDSITMLLDQVEPDVDTTGDGVPDAISAAFAFTAVPAVLIDGDPEDSPFIP